MKLLTCLLAVVIALVSGLGAQTSEAVPGTASGSAAEAARKDLEKGMAELAALREQISAEKLPLTRRLADLEATLTRLRGEQDAALLDVDQDSLDRSKVEQETKLREEELSYVITLLDEYARALESRLTVGEPEGIRRALAAAKDASTDNALTRREKMDRQIQAVQASLARIESMVGGHRFPGTAVEPGGDVTQGQFAIIGPVALFASEDGRTAGVALAQAGSERPMVRPLEEAGQNQEVAGIVLQGAGLLPFDPTRGGAIKDLVQKTNLVHIFKQGGPIMWPLLVVSILALGTSIERVLFLDNEQRKRDPRALQDLFAAAEEGDLRRAIEIGSDSGYYVARTMAYALEHRERSLANALLFAVGREIKRFGRGVPILDTAITIAPLLGLLGTVTGMMHSFSLIGGDLSAPGAITGGIAEALIATAFGLGIAIVSLLPYNFLNTKLENARHELEAAGHQLELIVRGLSESGKSLEPAAVPAWRA